MHGLLLYFTMFAPWDNELWRALGNMAFRAEDLDVGIVVPYSRPLSLPMFAELEAKDCVNNIQKYNSASIKPVCPKGIFSEKQCQKSIHNHDNNKKGSMGP